ncbi:LytTR family DNA-binding domain-containing protein [uncultured Duncaniella sp.]|uniref:LytR/AlgR family response regulator transcription factor n=2 Tax=uncultured Duncaniella sp. TaxID=2768039 RepID=UPI002676E21F|nr:LytTR family DNA-binding domain-containing protein [uncultured Duncaniella sp.]MCI9171938.1 response regulator transcription factor [Muribaculaceae bacterium]
MSMTIRCVAIDDEPLALDVIDKFCQRIGGIELSTFSDPVQGLEMIRREKPAIAFLDIEMENITGLDIASQLPEETCFIFTTAYLNYAMEGFELDAVDYLHKPFAFSRFKTAFARAMRRLGIEDTEDSRSILVKHEYNNVSIPLSDILYIEAMEGYVKIYREGDECTISRVILKNIGSQLPEKDFIRIHRSFIVGRSKIKSFNKREVNLKNGMKLPVGRQYSADVMALLS